MISTGPAEPGPQTHTEPPAATAEAKLPGSSQGFGGGSAVPSFKAPLPPETCKGGPAKVGTERLNLQEVSEASSAPGWMALWS